MVEQFAYNEKVNGSSPLLPILKKLIFFTKKQLKISILMTNSSNLSPNRAGVVKLVDTPGLGPGAFSHTGSSPVTRILSPFNKIL